MRYPETAVRHRVLHRQLGARRGVQRVGTGLVQGGTTGMYYPGTILLLILRLPHLRPNPTLDAHTSPSVKARLTRPSKPVSPVRQSQSYTARPVIHREASHAPRGQSSNSFSECRRFHELRPAVVPVVDSCRKSCSLETRIRSEVSLLSIGMNPSIEAWRPEVNTECREGPNAASRHGL